MQTQLCLQQFSCQTHLASTQNNQTTEKTIRILCLTKHDANTEPLFKKLKILNATDTLKLHELKLYYKYVHTTLPVYLQNLPFILNKTFRIFNTRIHDIIHTNRVKHDFAKIRIMHDIHLLINNTTFKTNLLYMWTAVTIDTLYYSVSFVYLRKCTYIK